MCGSKAEWCVANSDLSLRPLDLWPRENSVRVAIFGELLAEVVNEVK
jgi:hypothetical protein